MCRILTLILCCSLLCGCCSKSDIEIRTQYENEIRKLLPTGSSNIKLIDRFNATFELTVDGKKRLFMVSYWYGPHGSIGKIIVELQEQ